MDQLSGMMDSCLRFEVKVHTSPGPTCGTFNRLWLNLIGSQGETPPVCMNEHLLPGSVCAVLFCLEKSEIELSSTRATVSTSFVNPLLLIENAMFGPSLVCSQW